MGGIRKKYDEDFKKNVVKLSYASPKPVKEKKSIFNWQVCNNCSISISNYAIQYAVQKLTKVKKRTVNT